MRLEEREPASPTSVPEREGWIQLIRTAPLGVLVLAAILAFVAAGSIVGGIYLTLTAAGLGWAGWAMLLVAAPVSLYMALHLVRRTHWAWMAMVIALFLLLLSSLLRALFSPGIPVAALAEIALELLFLFYLFRPRIRASFSRA